MSEPDMARPARGQEPSHQPGAYASRPKVLLIGADLSTGGGVNRVITDLAAILSAQVGCAVTVVNARSSDPPTYPLPAGVCLEVARGGRRGLLQYLLLLLRLRRRRFDFAFGFWTEDNVLLSLAFLMSRTRLILCEHNSYFYPPRHVRLLRRFLYPLAARVTVLNRAEYAHYSTYLQNVSLVPNPLAPPPQAQAAEREKLVIGVGHLIARKGFDQLIQAWNGAGLAEQGWRLVIIGAGPEQQRLQEQIDRDSADSVSIVPPTPDIAAWYRRASLIAVTSDVEVFSLVLAEAILAGVVPVAYRADGPAFILEEFPEHLVPIGATEALSTRLRELALGSDLPAKAAALVESVLRRMGPDVVEAAWRRLILDQGGLEERASTPAICAREL